MMHDADQVDICYWLFCLSKQYYHMHHISNNYLVQTWL